VVDRRYAEPVGSVSVTLTSEGQRDPLLGGLPATFDAFVGHKEALSRLPDHAVLLASSATCPVQAFRIGCHVYATQFHPELDAAGLCTRIDVYKHAGYFEPEQAYRAQGTGLPQQGRPPARHRAPVRPALQRRGSRGVRFHLTLGSGRRWARPSARALFHGYSQGVEQLAQAGERGILRQRRHQVQQPLLCLV
jgi:GMP synthase (glutamine-hydrolysing)